MKNKKKIFLIFFFSFLFFFSLNLYFFSKNTKKNFSKKNYDNFVLKIISKKNIDIYKNYGLFDEKVDSFEINNKSSNGIVFSNDGKILTNKHILAKNNFYIGIDKNNKKYNLEIKKIFSHKDLVILKIKNNKKNWGKIDFLDNVDDLKINQKIYFYNKKHKKIFGKILQKNFKQKYFENFKQKKFFNLLETDLKVFPGDSGKPVFDKNNKIIGIISFFKDNKTYIIPLEKNILK